jgi:hypothetical protein
MLCAEVIPVDGIAASSAAATIRLGRQIPDDNIDATVIGSTDSTRISRIMPAPQPERQPI